MLTAVGLHVADLISVHDLPDVEARPVVPLNPRVTATVISRDQEQTVRVEGTPGTRIVMMDGQQPIELVIIGDDGVAEARIPEGTGETGRIRLVTLSDASIALDWQRPEVPSPKPSPPRADAPQRRVAGEEPDRVPAHESAPDVSPPVLQLVSDAGPRIALTFDGNSSSNGTGDLLDLLHELDLEATLFVTGRFIERYPDIIRRAVLSGHEVGNHTYSHLHLTTYEENRRHGLKTGVTRERFQNELRRTERAFRRATGRAMAPLWRAPYGEENRTLRGWALEIGYLHIRWSSLEGASLDSRDWVADEHSSMYQNSSTMMKRLLSFPELRGGIVLMHLATSRDEPPWKELPTFVESLRNRGVSPTTVAELLEASPTWRPWLRRARIRHADTFER
jgi:peptidoglycan/xylan/chitin deacetylase (PgdA/CDA1 family)